MHPPKCPTCRHSIIIINLPSIIITRCTLTTINNNNSHIILSLIRVTTIILIITMVVQSILLLMVPTQRQQQHPTLLLLPVEGPNPPNLHPPRKKPSPHEKCNARRRGNLGGPCRRTTFSSRMSAPKCCRHPTKQPPPPQRVAVTMTIPTMRRGMATTLQKQHPTTWTKMHPRATMTTMTLLPPRAALPLPPKRSEWVLLAWPASFPASGVRLNPIRWFTTRNVPHKIWYAIAKKWRCTIKRNRRRNWRPPPQQRKPMTLLLRKQRL
mmetsp:Transcript_17215/g.39929  ORF Transcript_17215/g.39929 Transcript_17215/m.39929 type:complete len:267 (+) Transcript_17215:1084-1884(+)